MPIAVVAFALTLQSSTHPFVDPLFSDNMILQRDMSDPIWGWTTPGSKIKVSIDGKTVEATADSTGKWITKLPKFSAGGSYTLSVAGPSSATFSNVTFGDVWICSGQSNMEMGIAGIANATQEIAAAKYPNIRLYRVPKLISATPVPHIESSWQVCTPESIATDGDWGGFSAVGYFFGRQLHQDLNVPIGLIHTSWGGTIAEAWASEKFLEQRQPEFIPQLKQLKDASSSTGTYSQQLDAWYAKNDPGSNSSPKWSDPTASDSDWHTTHVPGYFQKSGFPELVNNASVVWYRKAIELPADADLSNAVLHFIVDDNDATWINGTLVGATNSPMDLRSYKLPAGVLKPGKNLIAVRVTDTGQPGGFSGGDDTVSLELPSGKISLAGDWKVKLGTKIDASNYLPYDYRSNPNQVTVLYNGMIYPLAPFGVKGAIWYQGESNVGRAKQYATLLPTMIQSWRDTFGHGDFPFFIVQLAGFMQPKQEPGEDGWAELREAQEIASITSRNAGIATAIDIGEQADIHPKNKQDVGKRLALVAEAKVYGKKIEFAGPTFKSMKVEGSTARLTFTHAKGLKTFDGQAPRGFSICGADRKWQWAEAKIDGNSIIVSSSKVPNPTAVRYAWASFTDLNLQNSDGLPAFPFRTDK